MFLRPSSLRAYAIGSSALMAAMTALSACDETKNTSPTDNPQPVASHAGSKDGGALPPSDSGVHAVVKDAAPPPYEGPLLGALFLQTPIMSEMEWPREDRKSGEKVGALRLGYLRQGQKVPVIAEAHPKANCRDGWYELVQGGFVCGKYATLDMNHPRIKHAPHAPDMVGALPYQYGYNVANGTPLYRQVPSREERLQLEPWLAPKPKRARRSQESDVASSDDFESGASSTTLSSATLALTRSAGSPGELGGDPLDAGVPWYLRDYDGGKPQVTLDDLKGEGPIARRMVKGFFLALDTNVGSGGSLWWKTVGGLLAPADRVIVYKQASDFHGVWLDEGGMPILPVDGGAPQAVARPPIKDLAKPGSEAQVGIVTSYKCKKYVMATSRKSVTAGDPLPRHSVLRLTGESVSVSGTTYYETDEGWWMKGADGVRTIPGPPPGDLKPGEKWIDVNVKTQTLVAFEGDRPVFATAVSSGLESRDKEKDHRTPRGTFRIREKHIAATMDGDVASDGPYSIEDVPWIMYFNGSYALHGAFWHNLFGRTKSHGCVNLAPLDAKALFAWTEPHVPDGWHGVMATTEKPGTRVVVHD